jgi:hypothetical protein
LRLRLARDAIFCPADLTTFCRLDDLGLEVVGQQPHPDHAVLLCRVVEPDDWKPCLRLSGVAARSLRACFGDRSVFTLSVVIEESVLLGAGGRAKPLLSTAKPRLRIGVRDVVTDHVGDSSHGGV